MKIDLNITLESAELRKIEIKKEIVEIYDELNSLLLEFIFEKQRKNYYRAIKRDFDCRKLVNKLERLTNELHILNDFLDGKIKVYSLNK